MKKLVMTLMVTLVMVFGGTSLVKAEEVETVQGVLNEIQQVAETKEEITKEVRNLTVNELEEVDNYLTNKPNISVTEQAIKESVQDILSGGNNLNYALQDNLKDVSEKETLEKDVWEVIDKLTDQERKDLHSRLAEKNNRTVEEDVLYEALDKMGSVAVLKKTLYNLAGVFVVSLIMVVFSMTGREGLYDTILEFVGVWMALASITMAILYIIMDWETVVLLLNGL